MIVKTKEDVAKELPKLIVSQRYCTFEPEQLEMNAKLFEELDALKEKEKAMERAHSESELKNNEEYLKLEANIMARQTFAQELANSEELLKQSESDLAKKYLTKAKSDNKLELLVDLVSEIIESGEKVCIFSKFVMMQDIITKRFKQDKQLKAYEIAYVRGEYSDERRYEEINTKFLQNDKCPILLCSDSAAEGINLNGCQYLIEYDLANSYAIQTQRHGRIQRASATHDTVYVYQLIMNESFDEIAMKIINKKEYYDAALVHGEIRDGFK